MQLDLGVVVEVLHEVKQDAELSDLFDNYRSAMHATGS
jgi:hypothetical protein